MEQLLVKREEEHSRCIQSSSVVRRVDGMTRVGVAADQRWRHVDMLEVSWSISARYVGTVPRRQRFSKFCYFGMFLRIDLPAVGAVTRTHRFLMHRTWFFSELSTSKGDGEVESRVLTALPMYSKTNPIICWKVGKLHCVQEKTPTHVFFYISLENV